jgi:hypothetical protein
MMKEMTALVIHINELELNACSDEASALLRPIAVALAPVSAIGEKVRVSIERELFSLNAYGTLSQDDTRVRVSIPEGTELRVTGNRDDDGHYVCETLAGEAVGSLGFHSARFVFACTAAGIPTAMITTAPATGFATQVAVRLDLYVDVAAAAGAVEGVAHALGEHMLHDLKRRLNTPEEPTRDSWSRSAAEHAVLLRRLLAYVRARCALQKLRQNKSWHPDFEARLVADVDSTKAALATALDDRLAALAEFAYDWKHDSPTQD